MDDYSHMEKFYTKNYATYEKDWFEGIILPICGLLIWVVPWLFGIFHLIMFFIKGV